MDAREFLRGLLYTRQEVDDWFAGRAFPFSRHDSELGWLLRDGRVKDGVDGSTSRYHYDPDTGARQMIRYAGRPCRVNTYGDSFTQCHQVSDGETWQEVLAAHLGEPIRNFGVGGWSVYQAWLRMKRGEARTPAECIILNIWEDDHYRNLDAWRSMRMRKHPRFIEPTLPHVRVNPDTGEFVECPNPCPDRESFYNLCDLDWVCERFKDDFVLQIMLAHANARAGNPERTFEHIAKMATAHGVNTRIDDAESLNSAAHELHTRTALFSTMRIVERVERFARETGKKALYVLSFGGKSVARRVTDGTRFDQPFVEFMNERKLPYVDLLEAHAADFAQFRISVEDYLKRYFIGHYNPLGNFFTASAIKEAVVAMLDPKPPAYAPAEQSRGRG